MMRHIIRLVLPVAVLAIITGMLPVLPTDIGGEYQFAQVSNSFSGTSAGDGILGGSTGNGNTFVEQRVNERIDSQINTGGTLNFGSGIPSGYVSTNISSDPIYYQVVTQESASASTGSTGGGTSVTGSTGSSEPSTGSTNPVTGGSGSTYTQTQQSPVTGVTSVQQPIQPVQPIINPVVTDFSGSGAASELIPQQFEQNQTSIVEAQNLSDFSGGNLLTSSYSDLPADIIGDYCHSKESQASRADCEKCCGAKYKSAIEQCQNKGSEVERNRCVTNNTKLQANCSTLCSKVFTSGSSAGAGTQATVQDSAPVQVWVQEGSNFVTITSESSGGGQSQGGETQTVVLLPGNAKVYGKQSECGSGCEAVQIAPIAVRASQAVAIAQSNGARLEVQNVNDLLAAITVDEISGQTRVPTTQGTFVVQSPQVTAFKTLGLGVTDVIVAITSNVSDFFSGLFGGNNALVVALRDCEKEYNDRIGACFTEKGENVQKYTSCIQDADNKKKECEKANESSSASIGGGSGSGGAGDGGAGGSGDGGFDGGSSNTTDNPPTGGGGGRACGELGSSAEDLLTGVEIEGSSGVVSSDSSAKQCGGVCKDSGTTCGVTDAGDCGCVPLGFSSPTTALTCPSRPIDHEKTFAGTGTASDEITINRAKGEGACINAKTTCVDTPAGALSGNYSYVISSCETTCENEQKSPEAKSDFQDRAYETLSAMEFNLADAACANAQAAVVSSAQAEKTVCDASCPNDGETTNCQACGIKGEIIPGTCGNFEGGGSNGVTFSTNVKSAVIKVTMTATAEGSMKWQAKCGLTGGITVVDTEDGDGDGDGGGDGGGSGNGSGSGGGGAAAPELLEDAPVKGISGIVAMIGSRARDIIGALFGYGQLTNSEIVANVNPTPTTTTATKKICNSLGGDEKNPLGTDGRPVTLVPKTYQCPADASCADGSACRSYRTANGAVGCGCLPAQQKPAAPATPTTPATPPTPAKPPVTEPTPTPTTPAPTAPKPVEPKPEPVTPSTDGAPVVSSCGPLSIKPGDTTVLSIEDLENQVTEQVELAAGGALGEDETPATIITLYRDKLTCGEVANACTAGKCTPRLEIENGKAVASCRCGTPTSVTIDEPAPQPPTPPVVPPVVSTPAPVTPPVPPKPDPVPAQPVGPGATPFKKVIACAPAVSALNSTAHTVLPTSVYTFLADIFGAQNIDKPIQACVSNGVCSNGNACVPADGCSCGVPPKSANTTEFVTFEQWKSMPESCAKYSPENMQKAVAEELSGVGDDTCPAVPADSAPAWQKKLYPFAHPDCAAPGAKQTACGATENACSAGKCTLSFNEDGCECSSGSTGGTTPTSPSTGGGNTPPPVPPVVPPPAPPVSSGIDTSCHYAPARVAVYTRKDGRCTNCNVIMGNPGSGDYGKKLEQRVAQAGATFNNKAYSPKDGGSVHDADHLDSSERSIMQELEYYAGGACGVLPEILIVRRSDPTSAKCPPIVRKLCGTEGFTGKPDPIQTAVNAVNAQADANTKASKGN